MRLYRRLTLIPLFWRIIVFFASLSILWVPWASIIYGFGYWSGQSELASTIALISLYVCFVAHAWFWGRWGHAWPKPFRSYGFVFGWRFVYDIVFALVFGLGLIATLFGAEVLLAWASLHPKPLMAIVLEGFVVGLGVGFAEELLFRGWLLTELQISLSRPYAIFWSSVIFAIAHFIKPPSEILRTSPQFLGLLLLGLILGSVRYFSITRRSFTSLGLPIGLHAGLLWGYYIVDVGDLVRPSGHVSEWVTGIHGNPLSGALGVAILGCLTMLVCVNLRSE